MRAPGDKLGKPEVVDIVHKLLNDQVVRNAQIGSGESQLGERQVKTVHTERDLIAQFTEIGLLQAWAVPNDKGAFAFVNILQFAKTPDARAPPGMQICIRQLRDAAEGVIGIADEIPERLRDDLFEGLFHNLGKKKVERKKILSTFFFY